MEHPVKKIGCNAFRNWIGEWQVDLVTTVGFCNIIVPSGIAAGVAILGLEDSQIAPPTIKFRVHLGWKIRAGLQG
jgi:hypothetical protein